MFSKQAQNLAKKIENTQKSIELENIKKNADEERIEELKEQAEDAQQQIQELYDNLRDEIVGSYEDLSSTLSDAMIDALRNGEDALKAWSESVDEIIGDIVKKIAVQKYVEPEVNKALDQLYNKIMPKTAAAEKAAQKMQSFEKGSDAYNEAYKQYLALTEKSIGELPNITEGAIKEFKETLEKLGVNVEPILSAVADLYGGTGGLTALEKGIQGLTEDQGEVLASYWNAVRGYTASIDAKMDVIIANMTMSAEDNPMLEQLRSQTTILGNIYTLLNGMTTTDTSFSGKAFKTSMK